MGRVIAGLVAGIVSGLVSMLLIAFIGGIFYPLPLDVEIRDPVQQVVAAFPGAPLGAKLFIALAWLGGGLDGALVGRLVSRSAAVAWAVAALMALVALANIFVLPMPAWMQISALALPILGGILANHLAARISRNVSQASTADA